MHPNYIRGVDYFFIILKSSYKNRPDDIDNDSQNAKAKSTN